MLLIKSFYFYTMEFIPESPTRDDDMYNDAIVDTNDEVHSIEMNFSTNYHLVFDIIRVHVSQLPANLRAFVEGEGNYTHVYVSEDWYYQDTIWGSELQLVNTRTPEAMMRNPESYLLNEIVTPTHDPIEDTDYPFCFCTLSLEKVFWHRINTYPIPEGQVDDYDPDFDHVNWE